MTNLICDVPLNAYLLHVYGGKLPKSALELRFVIALELSVFSCLKSLCTHINEYRQVYELCRVEALARLSARIARVLLSNCEFDGAQSEAELVMLDQALRTAVHVMYPEELNSPRLLAREGNDDDATLYVVAIVSYVESALSAADVNHVDVYTDPAERIDACYKSLASFQDIISLQASAIEQARLSGEVSASYDCEPFD